jgi:hypothetical protein
MNGKAHGAGAIGLITTSRATRPVMPCRPGPAGSQGEGIWRCRCARQLSLDSLLACSYPEALPSRTPPFRVFKHGLGRWYLGLMPSDEQWLYLCLMTQDHEVITACDDVVELLP